jgi:hypothetical protein
MNSRKQDGKTKTKTKAKTGRILFIEGFCRLGSIPKIRSLFGKKLAYQFVSNGGGHSYLNLWAPFVDTVNGQIFSLSQHWYVRGSGGNLQTLECGWQAYPQFYNDDRPHLFTYWTADNYNTTGCYNLTCDAFVQLPGAPIAPGMPLGPVSVIGGQQFIIELSYWHTGGRLRGIPRRSITAGKP